MVPCLNIASSERPFLSQVTSSCPPSPSSDSLPPSFHFGHSWHLPVSEVVSYPHLLIVFLTRDSRAHQSRNAVCSVLITSGCSGQHKACGHFVLVEWMNEFINDCQKNKLFRLDTVFDFYRFEHIRFSLGFLKRVSHWKIILLFLIQLPVDGLKYLSYFKLSIPFCLCIRARIPPGQCFTIFFALFAPI